jgi:thiosulfate/3-mercaptopyruvate sulfurtransferase
MTLVSTHWLDENLSKVKIIDCSWHMPSTGRDGYKEYLKGHIPGALFFDLDKNSEPNTDLPHMLPKSSYFQEVISNFGIINEDKIIFYDNSDVFSACRCWFTFFYFGHNPKKLAVLNGGLKKWKLENKSVSKTNEPLKKSNYIVNIQKNLVKNIDDINKNITDQKFEVIDARSKKRFEGLEPEPRPGLRSGHIEKSKNLPFVECINKTNNTFKSKENLIKIFEKAGIDKSKNPIFTCGSGVTAAVLSLAFRLINDNYSPIIYDGSWSEIGKIK